MDIHIAILSSAMNQLFPFMYADTTFLERQSMEAIGIVMVVFGSLVAMVLIISLTLVAMVWGKRTTRSSQAEESQLIQEIYHGLARMGERVETLETLLIERDRQHKG